MLSVSRFSSTATSTPALPLCPVCDHANPAGARFCNACGSPVHLVECEHCGAVNDRASPACYKCEASLRSAAGVRVESDPAHGDAASAAQTGALPALQECPNCEAVNDPGATLCHQCEASFGADVDNSQDASVPEVVAPDEPHALPEGGPSAPLLVEPPLHYVGVLTAPVDEAELEIADALAARQTLRGRRLGWAVAALLIMPSLIAATVYALEHRDKMERLIAYARAFIPMTVGSAPSVQPDAPAAPEVLPYTR